MRHLLLALLLLPLSTMAQEPPRPELRQELWTSIGIRGRVPTFLHPVIGDGIIRNLRLSADLGYRSSDVFFAGRQVYIDLGGRYKLSDLVSVGIQQRVAFRPDGTTRNRTELTLDLSHDVERLELGYRFNYQHNYLEWGEQREVFRNRFEAGYNLSNWKLDPAFSVEFFTWAGYQGLSYFGTRYKLGTEWSPGKGQSFLFALIHDRQRDMAWPTYRTIFSVDYVLYLNKF